MKKSFSNYYTLSISIIIEIIIIYIIYFNYINMFSLYGRIVRYLFVLFGMYIMLSIGSTIVFNLIKMDKFFIPIRPKSFESNMDYFESMVISRFVLSEFRKIK